MSSIQPEPRRIYFASPVGTFGTVRYGRKLSALRRRFPNTDVVEPCHLFLSTTDWLCHWDYLVTTFDAVVFFTSPNGAIGFGVHKEVNDAQERGLPVYWLNDAGRLIPDSGFALITLPPGNPFAVAKAIPAGTSLRRSLSANTAGARR